MISYNGYNHIRFIISFNDNIEPYQVNDWSQWLQPYQVYD